MMFAVCNHCLQLFRIPTSTVPESCPRCRAGGHEGWNDTCPRCCPELQEIAHA